MEESQIGEKATAEANKRVAEVIEQDVSECQRVTLRKFVQR